MEGKFFNKYHFLHNSGHKAHHCFRIWNWKLLELKVTFDILKTRLFIKWLTITFPKDKYILKILDPGIWQILLLRLVIQFFCDLLRQKKWYFLVEKIYFLRSRIRFLDFRLTKWHHHSLKGSGFLSVRKYIFRPDLLSFWPIGKQLDFSIYPRWIVSSSLPIY